ncbi:MAG TPA: STAS domain-containing protein [Candidatus Acidoferrales bacterium]|nr:STAS domain-containing protein [Candidatus Acidoferrales bacterium]
MISDPVNLEALDGSRQGHRILRLSGPLTLHTIFPFQEAVRADKAVALILDLSGVSFVDSVGIGALVGAYVSRQRDGRKLALVGAGDRVMASLRVSGLAQFFPSFPTIEAAESSMS